LELERDTLAEVPNGSARLCELWGNFAPFAVKENTFLQFSKIELLILNFEL